MKRAVKVSVGMSSIVVLCLVLSACPVTSQDCANAVNKYANTLQQFQNAEITLHTSMGADGVTPLISDATHKEILQGEIAASTAGHNLDAAISLASQGADPSQYVTLAQSSFDAMVAAINVADPATQQKLQTAAKVAGDALANAISLIQTLKAATPAAVTPAVAPAKTSSNHNPIPLWMFLFPVAGLAIAGASITLNGTLQLISLLASLEPEAFSLVLAFTTSLKGKTTAQIVAMNETLFNSVDATAQQQLNLTAPSAVPLQPDTSAAGESVAKPLK
jgi:hypothetical protein